MDCRSMRHLRTGGPWGHNSHSSGYDGTHRDLAPSSMVLFTHSNFYGLIRVNFSWSDKIEPHCSNVEQCTATSEEVGNGPR